jgi:hypothetical protein
MKFKFFTVLLLFFICTGLSAQSTAQEMENLLAANEITYAQAARFILAAADVFVTTNQEEAFWYAAVRNWLPLNVSPNDTARLDAISLLLMRSFNIEGGIMFSITKNAHHAYRELIYRDIIQGNADPFMRISGEQLLFYTGRILAERERQEAEYAQFTENRRTREPRIWPRVESSDLGAIFTQNITNSGVLSDDNDSFIENLEIRFGLTPRISFLLGDIGSFIFSMGFTVGFGDDMYILPEILRTEFAIRFGGSWDLKVGRFNYTDPLNFIADGLFDGFQIRHSSPLGRFSFGTWFTGALYKNNAAITMTEKEFEHYIQPVITGDYINTYFAMPRLIMAIDYEHPAISEHVQFNVSLIGQFEMTSDDAKLHTQYLVLKAGLPVNNFYLTLGCSLGLLQNVGSFNFAFAADFGAHYRLPTDFNSRLSFLARYATGYYTGAFIPITTRYNGKIFNAKVTGLTTIQLEHTARYSRTFGSVTTASYFIRNDLTPVRSNLTFESEEENHFLGGEIFTQLIYSPFSDLQLILGAGFFVPALGNNWSNANTVWRIDLTSVFALF